jgi:hypothetical protein
MDTIHVATIFADTRGYLSPEEPRDFAKSKFKNHFFCWMGEGIWRLFQFSPIYDELSNKYGLFFEVTEGFAYSGCISGLL